MNIEQSIINHAVDRQQVGDAQDSSSLVSRAPGLLTSTITSYFNCSPSRLTTPSRPSHPVLTIKPVQNLRTQPRCVTHFACLPWSSLQAARRNQSDQLSPVDGFSSGFALTIAVCLCHMQMRSSLSPFLFSESPSVKGTVLAVCTALDAGIKSLTAPTMSFESIPHQVVSAPASCPRVAHGHRRFLNSP